MNMIKEFTIMIVDDDVPSMEEQVSEITEYLKEDKKIETVNFHKIHVKDDTYLETINGHLEKHVDMILTDNSMLNPDDGLKLAKDIRDRFALSDILLYSTKAITKDDYRDLSHYTQIQTHDEKKIVDITKSLIDRNLSKWNDVLFLRGIVISESIEIELKMNEILMKFFEIPKDKRVSFENIILGNFSISLEAKKVELKQVLKEVGLEHLWRDISTKIMNLQQDRNKLAHGTIDPKNVNRFVLGTTGKTFDKEKIILIFSNIKYIDEKLLEFEKALERKISESKTSDEQPETESTQ